MVEDVEVAVDGLGEVFSHELSLYLLIDVQFELVGLAVFLHIDLWYWYISIENDFRLNTIWYTWYISEFKEIKNIKSHSLHHRSYLR